MRLHDADCMLIYEAFEMLIEMAVIVITIITEMKTRLWSCQLLNRFPDTKNLQSLFTADAGRCFKIPLQSTGTDLIFFW